MKKATVLILLGLLSTFLAAEDRFMITASANVLAPADSGYKDIYGGRIFFPQAKLAFRFYDGFIVWAGYSYIKATGKTSVFQANAKSTQNFLSFGAGYRGAFSETFSWQLDAGLVNFAYKEEALGETASGSALGFSVGGTVFCVLWKIIVLEAEAGYLYGKDTINGTAIKLGGLRGGLGLGLRF